MKPDTTPDTTASETSEPCADCAEQAKQRDDGRDARFDRLLQTVSTIATAALGEFMHPTKPADTAAIGGLHCDECADLRDALFAALGDLEDHLERSHNLWPFGLQPQIDLTSATISGLSVELRKMQLTTAVKAMEA